MKMKKYIYISMALAATMFTACSSDDALDNVENGTAADKKEKPITIVANLPQESATRVSYTDVSDGSTYSLTPAWEGEETVRCKIIRNSSVNTSNRSITVNDGIATFDLQAAPDNNTYFYGYHPSGIDYSCTPSTSDNGATCSWTIPGSGSYSNAVIIYNQASDLKSKNLLIGKGFYGTSTTGINMDFKNVYALLKFKIYVPYDGSGSDYNASRFTTVTIKGWNGSTATDVAVGGDVTMTGSTGNIAWSNTTSGEYTRTANINLTNNGTNDTSSKSGYRLATLYVLVTPQTWPGLYLSATDNATNPHTYTYTKTGSHTFEAGKMYGINITLSK